MSYSDQEVSSKVSQNYRIGLTLLGNVVLGFKKALDISKIGIRFEGVSKKCSDTDKLAETGLFSIQDILWDAAPSKGKALATKAFGLDRTATNSSSMTRKTLGTTSAVGHTFLFAIRWPYVNFPPNLQPNRSVVQAEYTLRGFLQLSTGEEILSEPLKVEFRPHIDPSVVLKQNPEVQERRQSVVKDESGKTLGEASISCQGDTGTVFGTSCPMTLKLLIRQSEVKNLPRKAKIEVCEIHKLIKNGSKQQQTFVLSSETVSLPPELVKCHQETTIPLKVHIPNPEVDSRRGAMGLPTLAIGNLQVEYLVKVSIALNHSRFVSMGKNRVIVVECPVVVGNVKPKGGSPMRKIPRLTVNMDGEGVWDSQSASSSLKDRKRNIVEWSETCEIPQFLAGGDVGEDDIV
jgi:hypothetical protein